MKCICIKEHLDQALRYTAKATAKQSTLPIAQHIALSAVSDGIRCVATNLDVGVITAYPARVEQEGRVVIPPQLLQSFVSAVPQGGKISLERNADYSVTVESEGMRAVIKGFDPSDFPIIPEKSVVHHVAHFDATQMIAGLNQVLMSVAKTEARPELTGVFLACDGAYARCAATDGFRLAESVMSVNIAHTSGDGIDPLIIPVSALQEVLYVASDLACKTIILSFGDGQVFFDCGDVQIVSRLIAGTYPEYRQIIPKEAATTIVMDRVACERVARLSDVFAQRITSDMTITTDSGAQQCIVTAASHDRGENSVTLPAQISGNDLTIVINTRYFLDGITKCGTDKIMMRCASPAAPIVITPDGRDGFTYLVMPIRK